MNTAMGTDFDSLILVTTTDVGSALHKLFYPSLALGVVLAVVVLRRISPTRDLALVVPPLRLASAWMLAWIAWIAVAELIGAKLGVAEPTGWQAKSTAAIVLLCLGVVVLGPASEELVFRGLFYWKIESTRLGAPGAIAAGAVIFAVLHRQYGPTEVALILVDGLLFGLARYHSRSVILPLLMHCVGNSFAAWQRLHG